MPLDVSSEGYAIAVDDWNDRVNQFFHPEATAGLPKPRVWKKPYDPNAETLRATDTAMQVVSGDSTGYANFQVADPTKLLKKGEDRYFVPASELPPEIASDLGCKQRSCIETLSTGDTRVEARWQDERNVIHETMDQGSIGSL